MSYDAFNGSLVEQELIHVVGNEELPCKIINQIAIGDIRSQEVQAIEVKAPQVAADLEPAAKVRAVVPLTQAAMLDSSSAAERSLFGFGN